MPDKKLPPDNPEQSKRFEDKARELGADETGEAFERAVGVVVPTRPQPAQPSDRRKGDSGQS